MLFAFIFSLIEILCELQASPVNGTILCSRGLLYGSVCRYECDLGFSLIGNDSTRCVGKESPGVVGTWTNENISTCHSKKLRLK